MIIILSIDVTREASKEWRCRDDSEWLEPEQLKSGCRKLCKWSVHLSSNTYTVETS